MVSATLAAHPIAASSLALAAELGTLQYIRFSIREPSWRVRAAVELVPPLVRHRIPLDRVRAEIARDLERCAGVAKARPAIVAILVAELGLSSPRPHVLRLAARALARRDWAGALLLGASAAIAGGSITGLEEIREVAAGRGFDRQLEQLARRGFVDRHREPYAWGEFVRDVRAVGSEAAVEPSLPLVVTVVDAICASAASEQRLAALGALVARLPDRERWMARAHVARAVLAVVGERAALAELRAIRPSSVRAAGTLMVVRAAARASGDGDLDVARSLARGIEPALRQHAELAIVRAEVERAVRQNRARDLLRLRYRLGRIDQPGPQAEVWKLRMVIALRLRPAIEPYPLWPDGVLATAVTLPAWSGGSLEPEASVRAMLGVALTRSALAEEAGRTDTPARRFLVSKTGNHPKTWDAAAAQLRWLKEPRARRELLSLYGLVGLDAFAMLGRLRLAGARQTDAMLAELVATGAERLARTDDQLPEPMREGLAGAVRQRVRAQAVDDNADTRMVDELLGTPGGLRCPRSNDRGSLDRALFDEGIARSVDPRQHRRAIIHAARACLRGAIERPDAWEPEVIASRLRTLVQLGGGLAIDALVGALAIRPGHAAADRYRAMALVALCQLDLGAATRGAFDLATRPGADGAALREVELHGGVPSGFTDAWSVTRSMLSRRVDDAQTWLARWIALRGVPSVDTLEWLGERARRGVVPRDPAALIDETVSRTEALRHVWPVEAVQRISADAELLDAVLLVEQPALEPIARAWSNATWIEHVKRAASDDTGVIDHALVSKCARRLGKPELERWLLAGDLAAFGVERSRDLAGGLRLRLLDKRLDVLTYLRFADVPIWNCFRTNTRWWPTTRNEVIAVWKDPLTFVFRIERTSGQPLGFVFGGFAVLEGGAFAIVLNGINFDDESLEVRTTVLRGIEGMLAPLGIRELGIGNAYGWPLPSSYRERVVRGTRYRALRIRGSRHAAMYDDISRHVNCETELELWWAC